MLAKDMSTQGKSLEKFYLKKTLFETCLHYRKRKDCIIVYIYDGNKHGKVVFVWGKPLPNFYQRRWVTVYVQMILEVLWDRQEA